LTNVLPRITFVNPSGITFVNTSGKTFVNTSGKHLSILVV
jgi:hypothetical protein